MKKRPHLLFDLVKGWLTQHLLKRHTLRVQQERPRKIEPNPVYFFFVVEGVQFWAVGTHHSFFSPGRTTREQEYRKTRFPVQADLLFFNQANEQTNKRTTKYKMNEARCNSATEVFLFSRRIGVSMPSLALPSLAPLCSPGFLQGREQERTKETKTQEIDTKKE